MPGFYEGWQLTVRYPVTGGYDIREIVAYEGKSASETRTFKVELKV